LRGALFTSLTDLDVVSTHHAGTGEDVPLHGEVQVVEAEPARQGQVGVEGVDNQFVTVAAVGRCHAAVAGGLFDVEFAQHARPAVRPLNVVGSAQAFVFGNGSALQVGNQPVRPDKAAGGNRIFVFQYDGKGLRACGRVADVERDGVGRHAVRAELAAAFAETVGKFAVDNRAGVDLHDGLLKGWLGSVYDMEIKGRLKRWWDR